MGFYWLKYKISSRGSSGHWEWRWLGNLPSKEKAEAAAEVVVEEEIAQENSWMESCKIYSQVEDWAPPRIVSEKMSAAEERRKAEEGNARLYSMLLSDGHVKECPQCKDAEEGGYRPISKPSEYRRTRYCPTCGREVMQDTLPYLLPPEEVTALKLLGQLVKKGRQTENKDWPAGSRDRDEPETGISPLQWLIDLGLAGGCCGAGESKTYWEASADGKAEWERQKNRLRKKSVKKG